ncbi:MAG: FIST C-terminal domain-containing protein, partial [Pseudomonadota bacterium]
ARQLVEGLGPAAEPGACKLLVAFIDPIGTRPDLVLEGVAARLGEGPCIVGGGANPSLSADRPAPVVFFEAEAATDAVVALALCGAVRAETATVTSWRPIGKRGVITHAEGDRIFHIDGRPALEFYRRNLGADVQTFIGAPLAIVESEKSLNIRAAIDFDEQAGSVRVGGLIANGDVVQLSYAGFDEILEGAGALAQAVEDARADAPALVLYCSCVVRKMFLALDVGAELERLRAPFGEGAAVAGYYAYGEISATAGAAAPKFRNQAIVALTLS